MPIRRYPGAAQTVVGLAPEAETVIVERIVDYPPTPAAWSECDDTDLAPMFTHESGQRSWVTTDSLAVALISRHGDERT
ncbi:hypothetical protein BN1232_02262 [Mycobacterium lentiflavum]|uniref:Uncharacterized protein n=1 Tax=Mycobacterium lentiflavum TaxID=141349 RepID=A0A0E4CMU4_MYCLN|nr:hypothetical protein BN1232_02262 [Mycobacterium lentiflavum]